MKYIVNLIKDSGIEAAIFPTIMIGMVFPSYLIMVLLICFLFIGAISFIQSIESLLKGE